MISGKTSAEIFESIRAAVQTGKIKPGDGLPSVRDLATKLDINRNTVAAAYKKLVDAGVAISKGRNGTVIRQAVREVTYEGTPPGLVLKDLAGGNPDISLLPDLAQYGSSIQSKSRLYGEPIINPELEKVGKDWLNVDLTEGFTLSITNGAVDAVERILSAYLIAGDKVAVEDPCFLGSINTINNNRYQSCAIPVDEEGIEIAPLARALSDGIQALIITPRAHNPTGFSLSERRAKEIKNLLVQYPQVLVIVDDHFSLLSTNTYHHIIPQQTIHWALIRSTSKILGPDLRLAFVASDENTAEKIRQRLNPGTSWVSHILQDLAVAMMNSPDAKQQQNKAKEFYNSRREKLVSLMLSQGIKVSRHHDGLNVWVPLKRDSSPLVMQSAQYGWLVRGGEVFGLESPSHGIRVTVSNCDINELEAIGSKLATLIQQYSS